MKYIKLFNNHNDYENWKNSQEYENYSLCFCQNDNDIHFNYHNYSKDYFTCKAIEDCKFSFSTTNENNRILQYSIDNGKSWNELDLQNNEETSLIQAGNNILFKGNLSSNGEGLNGIGTFHSSGNYEVMGNIASLIYNDDFYNQETLNTVGIFIYLFSNNRNLIHAKNLILPFKVLSIKCYFGMFERCMYLKTAPALPAITLSVACYAWMFTDCRSLINAPELPAINLSESCYYGMFVNCRSLINAPELPATILANSCYMYMFDGCTSLINAPALPATTLDESCYAYMFVNCTSLTISPILPALILVQNCYNFMFQNCKKLEQVTALFLEPNNISDININLWLANVSETGIFYKNKDATWDTDGYRDCIPETWNIQNY